MVKLKEFIVGKQIPISRLGTFQIKQNVFDFQPRTPNYEMDKAIDAYQNRTQISSGVNQMAMFILGDKISFTSKDQKSVEWMDKWYKQRKRTFNKVARRYTIETLVTGNPALEPAFLKTKEGGLKLDNVYSVQDGSRIYVNNNKKDYPYYDYIYKVPMRARGTNFKGRNVEQFRLSYITGDSFKTTWIWGIGYTKEELWVDQVGYSRDGLYGRGIVMCAIDDLDVLTQIIQNYATIARYRAIGKKIFTVTGEDGEPGEPEDMEYLRKELNDSRDRDHIIFNKKTEMKDLSYTGQQENMDFQANFLRQNIGSATVPNYMTPWAGTITYATANKSSVPFELVIKNYQEIITTAWNDWIIGALRINNPNLADDLSFKFGEISLETLDEKITNMVELYDRNVITQNELRKYIGWREVDGGDFYKKDLAPEDNFGFESVKVAKAGGAPNGDTFLAKESLKESNADDLNKFLKSIGKTATKTTTQIKYADLKNNGLRLIKADDGYVVYRSKTLLKTFGIDERLAAVAYFDNVKINIEKSFDEFVESNKDEDKIVDKLFKDVKEQQYIAIKKILKDLKDSNTLSEDSIKKIEKEFNKIEDNLGMIAFAAVLAMLMLNKNQVEDLVENDPNTDVKGIDEVIELSIKKDNRLLANNLEDALKNYNQDLSQKVRKRVTDAIVSGQDIKELEKDIKKDFNQYKAKAGKEDWKIKRITYNELKNTSILNQLNLWLATGYTEVIHRTTIDDVTGEKDRRFNGRLFDIGYLLNHSEDRILLHSGCRCSYEPIKRGV